MPTVLSVLHMLIVGPNIILNERLILYGVAVVVHEKIDHNMRANNLVAYVCLVCLIYALGLIEIKKCSLLTTY